MNRKPWTGMLALSAAVPMAALAGNPPNVVVIMADDLGQECIGAYGGTSYATPRIDRMAREGVRFANAHSQPICTPSRVQIMTGKYNVRNYIGFARLDKKESTFGNTFQRAGYKTCIVGKWQLSNDLKSPAGFGFDDHCLWKIGNKEERYVSPGLSMNGEMKTFPGQYGPDIQQAYAKDFIRRNVGKPFLLYYPITLVHYPFQPTPDSKDWDPKRDPHFSDERYFPDMMAYLDKLVGDMLDFLKEQGVAENTLVIFTADNGTDRKITSTCNGIEIQGGKGLTIQSGTHVPLIASWPGVAESGLVVQDLIDFSDVYKTICDAGNLSIAPEVAACLDGVSFFPQITGKKGSPRNHSYCWYMNRTDATDIRQFVQDGTYKLYDSGRFFNMKDDFFEKSPLAPKTMTGTEQATADRFSALLDHYATLRPANIKVQQDDKPSARKGK